MQTSTTEVDGVVHRATTRNESRMLIEIETDRVGSWSLCEQSVDAPYPKPGSGKQIHKQQIVIYEHQWPLVQAMVRTDAQVSMLADALAMAPQQPEIVEARKAAEAALAKAKTPSARERAEQAMLDVDGDVAREALRLLCLRPGMKDGLPPLLSAKVLKKAPPPPTPQNIAQNANSELAAVIARLIDERSGKGKPARE